MGSIYLAWRYIVFNWKKSIILVISISLIGFLPIALQSLLQESEQKLMLRAVSTPLIIGSKGNVLDLTMNSLYFNSKIADLITMETSENILKSQLALPIPMYVKFNMQGLPIVGTTLDYFSFRKLKLAKGRLFALLGECTIGSDVATKLGIKVGDSIISTPENFFNLAGIYPLKMKVVGILKKNNTADNQAVFIDLKTSWVIEGLGHGHQDLNKIKDSEIINDNSKQILTANKKLKNFYVINELNMESFHFHGNITNYPITSVIVQPNDKKSAVILKGRYIKDNKLQAISPKVVIKNLVQTIFQIKQYVDVIVMIVGFATVIAVILIFSLSLRLRKRELDTIYYLGCSRLTVSRLLAAEIMIITIMSGMLCFISYIILQHYLDDIVKLLFIF
jgi:putative ABC transport system permease protein